MKVRSVSKPFAVIGDGPLLGDLRRFAETLGIAKLTWLPGAISNIPDALRRFAEQVAKQYLASPPMAALKRGLR